MITQAQMHVEAVKREIADGRMTPTESLSMEVINLDNFQLAHDGGTTNIAELVQLKEKIDGVLGNIAGAVRFLIDFHKDSPMRKWDELEKVDGVYTIGLDLERLMQDESEAVEIYPGAFMSDNYALAEKLIEKYEDEGGNIKGFDDISFRDTAMWNITSKSRAKKFTSFINKNYITPVIDGIMECYNIKKVIFTDEGIDFEYNS